MGRAEYARWLTEGIENGYLRLGCMQHDPPFSAEELSEHAEKFDNGDDPCLHVARVVPIEQIIC